MNPIKTLFILFSLFTIHHSLFAKEPLPLLVEGGELFKNRDDYYIDNRSKVNTVAITPNGKYIISGSDDGLIRMFDTEKKILIMTFRGHTREITSIVISLDGKNIISASLDKSIKVWDIKGNLLKELKDNSGIRTIDLSYDKKYIVSGSIDKKIRIWDIKKGKILKKFEGSIYRLNSIRITRDGKYIISGASDGMIKIWNMEKGILFKTLAKNTLNISSIDISNNGKYIVSGASDHTVRVWDFRNEKIIKEFRGHQWNVNSVVFSKDNKYIISASDDNTIKIWDIEKKVLVKTFIGHTDSINSVVISQNGKYVISCSDDKSVKFWNIKKSKLIYSFEGDKNAIDNGNFLFKKKWIKLNDKMGIRSLKPTYPLDYNLSKLDKLKLSIDRKNILMQNNGSIELNLTIKNQGDTSYFINIQDNSDYVGIKQTRVSKIKKGEIKNIPLKVYAKLPQYNPKPIKSKLNLKVVTGNGTEFNLSVPIEISFANIEVKKAEVSKNGKILTLMLKNIGNQKLEKAKVKLFKPIEFDIQEITNLDKNSTKELSFTIPKDFKFEKNTTLSLSVFIPNEYEEKNNPNTKVAPLYEWNIKDIKVTFEKLSFLYYFLVIFGTLIVIMPIIYNRRYKNPLIQKLSKKPKTLKTLNPTQLKEANLKLKLINQLDTTLNLANISKENFEKTLLYFKSQNDKKAELFAERIGAIECKKKGDFYQITMGDDFNLNNIRTFLLYITDKNIEAIRREVLSLNDKVFVIGSEEQQNSVVTLAHDKTNRLMATTVGGFFELMLSHDAQSIFIKILSQSLSLKDVSPYQLNGDVKNESNFFGRVEILREIISNSSVNYLIVGARQLGKSSILKALERRYEGSREINYYSFTLDESGDVLGAMSEVLGLGDGGGLDEIVVAIRTLDKKPIFLIDEADMFVKYEKERGYYITSVFRKLSQEGEAMFIMAGFWTLYEYVSLDYQSPLKNFGKLITLEGLEFEACRELMIEPMGRIGVRYESDRIIDEVIELCGRRANYIAIVCDVVLQQLEGSLIRDEDIARALDSGAVDMMLRGWEALSANRDSNRLDRLIVYLTITRERFRLGDVTRSIKEQGLKIDIERINESLDRLVLGYVIGKSKGDYFYQIPLLKQKLLEGDLEILIEGEVDGLMSLLV